MRRIRGRHVLLIAICALAFAVGLPGQALASASGSWSPLHVGSPLTSHQRSVLEGIAADTWKFYAADVDPTTHLPLDNLGPGDVRGTYTSAANIGVYLWAVVAAHDLKLISRQRADSLVTATLDEVSTLKRFDGFLYQWYDTNNGNVLANPNPNPGQGDCTGTTPEEADNCWFVSAVDNGWYASGLIEVRQALPELPGSPTGCLIRWTSRSSTTTGRRRTATRTHRCPATPRPASSTAATTSIRGRPSYHNGALYSDPRISMYIGMGMHQMPGDVWWRSWRVEPPKQCPTDPDFSAQGQWPTPGHWHVYTDPQSHRKFNVWEGHYVYPGHVTEVRADVRGRHVRGPDGEPRRPRDRVGPAQLRPQRPPLGAGPGQVRHPGPALPGVGDLALEHGGQHGRLQRLRRRGPRVPQQRGPRPVPTCATETTVSPHASAIALPILPQQAYANLQALRTLYPGIYTADGGFYDAVNPETKSIGHRRLVLDQSMIMAGLDDALDHDALQRRFASDPLSWAAHLYLSIERMSIG